MVLGNPKASGKDRITWVCTTYFLDFVFLVCYTTMSKYVWRYFAKPASTCDIIIILYVVCGLTNTNKRTR